MISTKHEARNTKQIRNNNYEIRNCLEFSISDIEFGSVSAVEAMK